jgi:hypothetical protein
LKALAVDIHQNLEAPLREIAEVAAELGLDAPHIRVAVRTGDTAASERGGDAPPAAELPGHHPRVPVPACHRGTLPGDARERAVAADPLNLVGIVLPGPRTPALMTNAVTYLDGVSEDAAHAFV